MSPEAFRKAFITFVHAVLRVFGSRYLNRDPTIAKMRRVTAVYAEEGFNGCIGSVDCMHISWKQCPFELKGQYKNPHAGKLATISCEGVCDHDLYCWSWYAGRAGTNNDLTVISTSPLFNRIMSATNVLKLPEGYMLNGLQCDWHLYYVCDGIYPNWGILVGPNHSPITPEVSDMTLWQESVRKDVERLFGCLQGRFKILRRESFEWSLPFLISQYASRVEAERRIGR
jgi:Plant transposon protein